MRHLALALLVAALAAGDAAPAPAPAPGPAPGGPNMRMPPMMGRGGASYEIEQLVIVAGDPAGLAAWAETAARGFHLITVSVQDGKQFLFFERQLQPGAGEPHVPAGITDPAKAAALRESIKRIVAERMPQRRAMPAPANPEQVEPGKASP